MAWISINFESKALGMPVMTNVLMPQGRGGYKTLYLLHGAGGDYASWAAKIPCCGLRRRKKYCSGDAVRQQQMLCQQPLRKRLFYISDEDSSKNAKRGLTFRQKKKTVSSPECRWEDTERFMRR